MCLDGNRGRDLSESEGEAVSDDKIGKDLDSIKSDLLGALGHAMQQPNNNEISEAAKSLGANIYTKLVGDSGDPIESDVWIGRLVQQAIDAETADLRRQLAEAKAREDRLRGLCAKAANLMQTMTPDTIEFDFKRALYVAGMERDIDSEGGE